MAAYRGSPLKFAWAPLIAGLAMATVPVSAAAETPTLMWSGAKRVQVLCNVAGGPGIDHVALTASLCRDIARLAAKGAPVPVKTIAIGDPAVLAGDAVTLIVQGSVATHHGDRLMAFTMRPYRSSTDETTVLFGAPPRAAAMSASGAGPALEQALRAALAETLPWQARPMALPSK